MFNYLLVNPSPGFTLQSIYLCTQPINSQSRALKYLSKNIYVPFFRLLNSGFGKLSASDASLPQQLQKPVVLEMVLLRSCNLKIESQNGVQRNLNQENQLLSEPHSSSWCCTLDQHVCLHWNLKGTKFCTNVYVFCIWQIKEFLLILFLKFFFIITQGKTGHFEDI